MLTPNPLPNLIQQAEQRGDAARKGDHFMMQNSAMTFLYSQLKNPGSLGDSRVRRQMLATSRWTIPNSEIHIENVLV